MLKVVIRHISFVQFDISINKSILVTNSFNTIFCDELIVRLIINPKAP